MYDAVARKRFHVYRVYAKKRLKNSNIGDLDSDGFYSTSSIYKSDSRTLSPICIFCKPRMNEETSI